MLKTQARCDLPAGKKQCMGCMELYDAKYDVCPRCGYEEDQPARELLHMDPGTVLKGRYVVGRALGYGGFGVTYIGYDIQLKRTIAIKEYLPSEFATRVLHQQDLMVANNEKKRQQFSDGMKKFIQEGQKLAQVSNVEGIVHMYDSFEANHTAYIVMEYLEGETLASFLEREGQMSEEQALEFIMPVLRALEMVHEKGIIHRDIAPDNIFLTLDENGKLKVKLIDFGAAKFATTSHSKSLTVIIKPGYSPEEQYRSNGDQGCYTDVYAIAAVLYRMVTGMQPPDAFERRTAIESQRRDLLAEPGKYNKELSSNFEIALLNAMNVRIEDRTATIADFEAELVSLEPVKRHGSSIRRIDFMRWPLWAKISIPSASVAAIALLLFVALKAFSVPDSIYTLPEGMTRVPDFEMATFEEAKQWAQDADLLINTAGNQYMPNTISNLVLNQDVAAGSVTVTNTAVNVMISIGQESYSLPDVTGMHMSDAKCALECMGLEVSMKEGEQAGLAGGCVVRQSIKPYSDVKYGAAITLTVTKEEKTSVGTVPAFTGLTYQKALEEAENAGVLVRVKETIFSEKYTETTVIDQDIASGEAIDGAYIALTIALPWREFAMPNLMFKGQDTAVQILKNIGITAKIQEETNEAVSPNTVFAQSIAQGTTVQPMMEAMLSVSTGGETFPMPYVEGMTESEARSTLSAKGLAVFVEYGYDPNMEEGRVISQNVAKDTEISRGTAVTITVCSSAGLVTVENVKGLSTDEARAKLEAQGLHVQVNEVFSNAAAGTVLAQTPPADTTQKEGTTVVLDVSKGPKPEEPTTPPDSQPTQPTNQPTQSASGEKKWRWSEWSADVPPAGSEYESKTQYRSRSKETTTSNQPLSSDSGWILYDTQTTYDNWSGWSQWSDTYTADSDTVKVETQMRYRYREKEYRESTNSSLSGWTRRTDKSPTTSYGQWGSWSDWSIDPVSGSDTREVETTTLYGYYYYRCSCGAHWHGYGLTCANWQSGYGCGAIVPENWNQKFSPVSWDSAGLYEWHGTGKYATDYFGDRWFKWNDGNGGVRTGYRYRDRSVVTTYYYERWGDWSDWSTQNKQGSNIQTDSRPFYRYCTRNKIVTYYYERYGQWSSFSDSPITGGSNVVDTRVIYRYKIYD